MSDKPNPVPRQPAARVAPAEIHAAVPALGWYTDNILFGEMWERPQLAKRERSLVTLTALITLGYFPQMVGHLNRGLDNGVTPTEIAELITHLAFYAGWPCAMSATGIMRQVFSARAVPADAVQQSLGSAAMARDGVPALEEFTERVVEADLWARRELAPRDRSLVTITALVAQAQPGALADHVRRGRRNGLTETQITEAIAHMAFYIGWPRATALIGVVRDTLRQP